MSDNDLGEVGRDEGSGTRASDLSSAKSDVDLAFQERMNVLAERAGGPRELARKSGLSRRVIDKYAAGDSDPSRSRLIRLASAGDVSLVWLAVGEGPMVPDPVLPTSVDEGDFVALPRYNVQAAAGRGGIVTEEYVVEYIHFRREWLRRTLGVNPAQLVVLEAAGDSMADTIKSGDVLIVDASDPHFRGDGIYVLNLDGALMVKRVAVRLAGGIRISSDNPRYTETLDVERDEVDRRVRFAGKVVWVGGAI